MGLGVLLKKVRYAVGWNSVMSFTWSVQDSRTQVYSFRELGAHAALQISASPFLPVHLSQWRKVAIWELVSRFPKGLLRSD